MRTGKTIKMPQPYLVGLFDAALDSPWRPDTLEGPLPDGLESPDGVVICQLSRRGVAQLGLERCVRDAEVEGSNPFAPIVMVSRRAYLRQPQGRSAFYLQNSPTVLILLRPREQEQEVV
jgi:hypothetical protein